MTDSEKLCDAIANCILALHYRALEPDITNRVRYYIEQEHNARVAGDQLGVLCAGMLQNMRDRAVSWAQAQRRAPSGELR